MTTSFVAARKHIDAIKADLGVWRRSPAHAELVAFIAALNGSVRGLPVSKCPPASPAAGALLRLLARLQTAVKEIPPLQQPQRFGNKAFRTFLQLLQREAEALLASVVGEQLVQQGALRELLPYLLASFGDEMRIDYGTGHELSFIALLCCLTKLGVFHSEDHACLVLRVFRKYLDVMRELQSTYWLEPAGSKGVWGLDDYQFLPLLWGASQLIGHKYIKPRSIHNVDVVEMYAGEYLYLEAVMFVKKTKTGVFAEHSPLLNDISAVATWEKVNSGLIKMYDAEVLGKFPIIQHFLFGSLLRLKESPDGQ